MWKLSAQAPATTPVPFSNEWIDHSAFHEAPLGYSIVRFETSLYRYIPLFSHSTIFLSPDWLSWCSGCFSRNPWIPLIHPSFKSFHVCRPWPPHKSHTMGVWTEENPMGRGDYHRVLELLWQKRDLLSPVLLSSTFIWSYWKEDFGIWWHGHSSLYLSETWQVNIPGLIPGGGPKYHYCQSIYPVKCICLH